MRNISADETLKFPKSGIFFIFILAFPTLTRLIVFEADVCGLVGFVVLVSNDHLNLGPWTFTVDADSVSHKTSCT